MKHIIKPEVSLKDSNANAPHKTSKESSLDKLNELSTQLAQLQEVLHAERKHKVLIIMQGMDASGKDGTIKDVFRELSPAHVRVVSFKGPTEEEADHDFLWRIHKQTPGKGELVIFNRSHYEDVLVTRVRHLVAPDVWKRRYAEINDFERMLTAEGTVILKFFLHIGKQEQKKRLDERLKDPKKKWKHDPQDFKEHKSWQKYCKAYEEVFQKTSTVTAPWHIIPANQNWYRNLVISQIIVSKLTGLKMRFPKNSVS